MIRRVRARRCPSTASGIVLAGVLQAHRRFSRRRLAPLLSSLVVIAAYLAYGALAHGQGDDLAALPRAATLALAAGTTLGVVALSLPLFVPVPRAGRAAAARRGASRTAWPSGPRRWPVRVCSPSSPSRSPCW